MSEFFLAIAAAILAAIGIICVTALATLAFACLLPASYLAALLLILRPPDQGRNRPRRWRMRRAITRRRRTMLTLPETTLMPAHRRPLRTGWR